MPYISARNLRDMNVDKPPAQDMGISDEIEKPFKVGLVAAIAILFVLMLVGGNIAIRESFIPGNAAENVVCFVIPALASTAFCLFGMRVRRRKVRAGISIPRITALKLSGLMAGLWVLIFASTVVLNFAGPVRCLAYLGELSKGSQNTQDAKLIRESDVKGRHDLGLAHVTILEGQRSEFFAWHKAAIFDLLSCPGAFVSITGYVTIFGMQVYDVQCSSNQQKIEVKP